MHRATLPLLAVPLALAAIAPPAYAADAGRPSQAIGLYVSNIAGSGLTYALDNGPAGMGFHVSGIGWGQNGSGFYNFGGAVTKTLSRQEWGGLYGLVAIGVGARAGSVPGSSALALETNFAPGVGVQVGLLRAELGYSLYRNDNGTGFTPAGGAGLFFGF